MRGGRGREGREGGRKEGEKKQMADSWKRGKGGVRELTFDLNRLILNGSAYLLLNSYTVRGEGQEISEGGGARDQCSVCVRLCVDIYLGKVRVTW